MALTQLFEKLKLPTKIPVFVAHQIETDSTRRLSKSFDPLVLKVPPKCRETDDEQNDPDDDHSWMLHARELNILVTPVRPNPPLGPRVIYPQSTCTDTSPSENRVLSFCREEVSSARRTTLPSASNVIVKPRSSVA